MFQKGRGSFVHDATYHYYHPITSLTEADWTISIYEKENVNINTNM